MLVIVVLVYWGGGQFSVSHVKKKEVRKKMNI